MTSDDVLFIHIRRRRNNMKRNFTLPSQTSINYFLLVLVQIFLSFQKKCIPFVILSRTARINMVMNGSNTPSNADVFDLNTQVFSPDENSRAGRDGYSVQRQPLSWQDSDPIFSAPKNFDDSKNKNDNQENNNWWALKQNQKRDSLVEVFTNEASSVYDDVSKSYLPSSYSSSLPVSNEVNFVSAEDELDLIQRSFDTLDFPTILGALERHCMTTPAKSMVAEVAVQSQQLLNTKSNKDDSKLQQTQNKHEFLMARNPREARQNYRAVNEILRLIDTETSKTRFNGAYYKNRRGVEVTIGQGNLVSFGGLSFDIESILKLVSEDGEVLQGPEILEISSMMNAMEDVQLWSRGLERIVDRSETSKTKSNDKRKESVPLFVEIPRIVQDINLNNTLQKLLEDAFDDDGKISGETFPVLGELRKNLRNLKADILQTLNDIIQLPSMKSKLALESGGPVISEVGSSTGVGRLVLPIDPKYSSDVGIVHDSSRSGKTMYVEPSEIVEPTNNLRLLERELEAEESRVWRLLTEQVWINSKVLRKSVEAVTRLDLCIARMKLGRNLNGIIPDVQDEGVIHLKNARHPVLLLRNIENVVGSDISLGDDKNQGLILTGPNAGGKTVILKLLGLLALMAKAGIPIPADLGEDLNKFDTDESYKPRFDYFDPVLADIGDIQSVGSDLSTFSGHMLVCKEVLEHVRSGKRSLVLMDELGSGTDPNQGVAIAQAVLEALLQKGCRVVITTHYLALKNLASSDDRFQVAGMQFVAGRPTYKLQPGVVGESYAIAVAERLKMPQTVIDRANELLDSETRQMGNLIRDLEDQNFLIHQQVTEMEEKKKEMKGIEIKMKEKEINLEKKMLTARRIEAKKFARKLEQKEKILEDILLKLKSDPSRKIITKSWEEIKYVKRDAIEEAENIPSVLRKKKVAAIAMEKAVEELVPLAEIRNRPSLNEGDKLRVCKNGNLFGREATVVKDRGKQIEVNISGTGMSLTMQHTHLSQVLLIESKNQKFTNKSSRMVKAVDKALESELKSGNDSSKVEKRKKKTSLELRIDANTIDVRGCNLFVAQERVTSKISECNLNGHRALYVLHGHGSGGILKLKLRDWLKTKTQLINNWSPASQSDGGDAFTRIEL